MKMQYKLLSVTLASLIAGCTNSLSTSSGVDPDLKKDEPKFFSQSGAVACASGAILSGLACLLVKDDNKEACVAVAAAGCAVAMTGNYMLDKLRSDYHNLEDQLDAVKNQINASIKSTESLNQNIKDTLNDDNYEIAQIEKGIAEGSRSKKDLEDKVEQMEQNLAYMKDRLAKDQENLEAQTDAYEGLKRGEGNVQANDPQTAKKKAAELEASIAKLNENISYLQGEINSYAERTSAVKSGLRDKAV